MAVVKLNCLYNLLNTRMLKILYKYKNKKKEQKNPDIYKKYIGQQQTIYKLNIKMSVYCQYG